MTSFIQPNYQITINSSELPQTYKGITFYAQVHRCHSRYPLNCMLLVLDVHAKTNEYQANLWAANNAKLNINTTLKIEITTIADPIYLGELSQPTLPFSFTAKVFKKMDYTPDAKFITNLLKEPC